MHALPYPEETVHAHLMPGKIIQMVDDVSAVQTVNDLHEQDISIVVNPDDDGVAIGKVLIAHTDSQEELESGTFEYYKLKL
jgi:archaeosine-15-forming tRNA-guanine transglycosylase